jgi:hypothetical protein
MVAGSIPANRIFFFASDRIAVGLRLRLVHLRCGQLFHWLGHESNEAAKSWANFCSREDLHVKTNERVAIPFQCLNFTISAHASGMLKLGK